MIARLYHAVSLFSSFIRLTQNGGEEIDYLSSHFLHKAVAGAAAFIWSVRNENVELMKSFYLYTPMHRERE